MTDKKSNFADEKGQRIRALRTALGLSRQDFANISGVPKGTLQNWEDGRYSGINDEGADKIVSVMADKANVQVSTEWLMYGAGQPPVLPTSIINQSTTEIRPELLTEEAIIKQEILLFHKLNKNSIDIIVSDDLMNPIFYKGDHVAGKRHFEFAKLLNSACIVQTTMGEQMVRIIAKCHDNNRCFNLLAYDNNKFSVTHKEVDIFSAAPIIWIRRKSSPAFKF